MTEFISDIDYVVRNTKEEKELLNEFYYTTFYSFVQHSDFAKILIKEQMHSFNKELILKIHYYDRLIEEISFKSYEVTVNAINN